MKIDLFIPCFIDQLYPKTAWNVVKILESLNLTVSYNPEQTCCGQPSFNSGYWKDARKMAEKFIKDFPNDNPIVSPSASCAGYIKNSYSKLFEDDSKMLKECNRLSSNVFELTDFLVNKLGKQDFGATFPHKVTYHDSCSALRDYKIKEEPRKLLNNVKGLELIEMTDTDVCCGFGGTFMVKYVPISTAMVSQKVENALKTGAEYIISADASCLLNYQSYIDKQNLPIKTIHLADVISNF